MSTERSTATLTELRPREITVPLPARLALRVTTPRGQGTVRVGGPVVTVGANVKNAVCVDDSSVSGVHCELWILEGGNVKLRDLGSKNGTWVDGARVDDAVLRTGSTFAIGKSSITVVAIDEVDTPVSTTENFMGLYGRGAVMGKLFSRLVRLADVELSTLIVGETGTGKEIIARGIHDTSRRSQGPYVVVDCTNLNEGVAESTLFGHCKGSFTHALEDHAGLLEKAHQGTLFLDEIGELPIALQPKLLRALEGQEVRRVGESEYRKVDIRVVAATNRDLSTMVCQGRFREDLYFRIAQIAVHVPPLRERNRGNVAMLADLFLARCAEERGVPLRFDREVYEVLDSHLWPGNVRELYGVVRSTAMMVERSVIAVDNLNIQTLDSLRIQERPREDDSIGRVLSLPWAEARRMFARIYHDRMLEACGGNKTEAAERAGMSRGGFRNLAPREDDMEGSD